LASADLVVTPTAAFAEMTRRAHRLPAVPTCVHNGRAPLPLPTVEKGNFAFSAGRLWDEGKNGATLDRVAAQLAVPFYAAGPIEGPNGAAVTLRHLRLLGTVDETELGRWLAARPVFVSAALYEPFGLAVLEAAAAGCPLVLADIPTFRELWGGAARFVDPRDSVGFADAVTEILSDAAKREEMGEAALRRSDSYSSAAMAAGMAALYRQLLRGKREEAPVRPDAPRVAA
jgi:glycosyltransferase involved in cell wall biosynthesis